MTDFTIENKYQGLIIAGVDEAGRGPFAGPVVAGAVIVNPKNIISGIKDSKKLTKRKREELYLAITNNCIWSVGIVSSEDIDQINILEATKKACRLAVESLTKRPEIVIVDGNMKFNDQRFKSIIKGDDKSISIAAASIIAKVTRDQIMEELGQKFPQYKWHKNSGYGTKEHRQAIKDHGLTEHHRKSFKFSLPA
ncbi:MAG: ribonuclease HII [Rickettsiaceae bacterium]|nr:ribonuclease HII [Rickettsiaceae bacterium]